MEQDIEQPTEQVLYSLTCSDIVFLSIFYEVFHWLYLYIYKAFSALTAILAGILFLNFHTIVIGLLP